jgi:hypothetical protein
MCPPASRSRAKERGRSGRDTIDTREPSWSAPLESPLASTDARRYDWRVPKPLTELEADSIPLVERILRVLAKDPANAYTPLELFSRVEKVDVPVATLVMLVMKDTTPIRPYQIALEQLVALGKVRRYDQPGGPYYAAGRP